MLSGRVELSRGSPMCSHRVVWLVSAGQNSAEVASCAPEGWWQLGSEGQNSAEVAPYAPTGWYGWCLWDRTQQR